MTTKIKFSILITSIFLTLPLLGRAETEFNPGFLISDQEYLQYNSMTLDQIQNFLREQGSYLSNYRTENAYGLTKSAAEIIYEASTKAYDVSFNSKTGIYTCDDGIVLGEKLIESELIKKCQSITTVNPKLLLVLLQKEMGLIENPSPSSFRLDFATGYMIFDGMQTCSPYDPCYRFKGFGKQINSAALQFRWYLIKPQNYKYQAGNTYTFKNQFGTISGEEVTVNIENQATAALYNYTPHVYNGNYNFWTLWNKYFPNESYPDGTILKVNNEYWLIQYGKKRKFSSLSVLSSRYNPKRALEVSSSALSAYEEGAPIRFHNYAIIMSPEGKLYLLVGDKKRLFSSTETFKKLGFNVDEIQNASWQDINSYQNGKDITLASAYPTGALLQNKTTGGVYWVEEETKAPLLDRSLLKTKFKSHKIIPVSAEELDLYQTVGPAKFDNGELIKSDKSPAVYLIVDGEKRAFLNGEIFESLGFHWDSIITTGQKIVDLYPDGALIQE